MAQDRGFNNAQLGHQTDHVGAYETGCAKNCDALDPDDIDGWQKSQPITSTQQLDYNQWLTQEAHSLGLSIALKNDLLQAKTLAPFFDFLIAESAYTYNNFRYFAQFVQANKAVF